MMVRWVGQLLSWLFAAYLLFLLLDKLVLAANGGWPLVLRAQWAVLHTPQVWRVGATGFLGLVGVLSYQQLGTMLRYCMARKTLFSLALLALYIGAVLGFLKLIPLGFSPHSLAYPLLALFIIFFPSLFARQAIRNPIVFLSWILYLIGHFAQLFLLKR